MLIVVVCCNFKTMHDYLGYYFQNKATLKKYFLFRKLAIKAPFK